MSTPMTSPTIAPKFTGQGFDPTDDDDCINCGDRDHSPRDCPNKQHNHNPTVAAEDVSLKVEIPMELIAVAVRDDTEVANLLEAAAIYHGTPRSLATRCISPVKESDVFHQGLHPSPPRCLDSPDSCRVIIHDGSSFDVPIAKMIIPLKLPPMSHQHRFDHQGISPHSGNIVSPQCLLPFYCGHGNFQFLCDVVAMDATTLFLGRPWQVIHRVLLAAYMNTSVFTYHGKHVHFLPLPFYEDSQDQGTRKIAQAMDADNNASQLEGPTFDPGDTSSRHQLVSPTNTVIHNMRYRDKGNDAPQNTAL